MGRKQFVSVFLLSLVCILPLSGHAEENIREKILATFHSYNQGSPQVEGITPGMTIDKTNAQVPATVLPPDILKYIASGDFSITVQPTTDLPLRQEYIDASIANYGKATLGDGELHNYISGRPFPLIDPQDPQAGIKVAWNLRYRDQGATAQMWSTNEIRNRTRGGVPIPSF